MERKEFIRICEDFGLNAAECTNDDYETFLYENDLDKCYYCGEWGYLDDMLYMECDDTVVCRYCADKHYVQCSDCGRWISRDDAIVTADYNYICNDCYCDYYFTCDDCGEVYHIDDSHCIDDYYYCDNCYQDHENSLIIDYHDFDEDLYVPRGNAANDLYMGIELEYDGSKATATYFHDCDIEEVFHFEKDCSVSGYECISQPCALEYWKKYSDTLQSCLDTLKYDNSTGINTGFHIHLSRDAFVDDIAIKSFVAYVNSFKSDFERLAGRLGNHWCSYDSNRTTLDSMNELGFNYDRYCAVNTKNYNTIEVRLFKSTMDGSYIINVLQVLSNLVDKVNNHVRSLQFNELLNNTDSSFMETYSSDNVVMI